MRNRRQLKKKDKGENKQNTNLYIGGAIIAGAVLLYSGLKYLFPKDESEKATTQTTDSKSGKNEVPLKPNPIEKPVTKTPPKEEPKKDVQTATKDEKVTSTPTKSFSAKTAPKTAPKSAPKKTDEQSFQETAKLLEKKIAETQITEKKMTKRIWKVLGQTEAEKFKVPKDIELKFFSNVEETFNSLDLTTQRFIYHLYQASWIASFINAVQSSTTKELFELLILIFSHFTVDELRDLACNKATEKVTNEEMDEFITYASLVFLHLGNYNQQDKRKFIPSISKTSFEKFINVFSEKHPKAKLYYSACESVIFDVTVTNQRAGVKGSDSIPYFCGEPSFEEMLLNEQDIANAEKYTTEGLLNSTLARTNKLEDGREVLDLVTSAIETKEVVNVKPKDTNFVIKRRVGLFSAYLKLMSQHLFASLSFLPGVSRQKDLILRYLDYFGEGSNYHFEIAQRLWQYEINPQVEFHYAFVPTYKDPFKKRGEFRSFIGLTRNKDLSQKILANARKILGQIPQANNFGQTPFSLPILEFVDLITFVHSFVPSSVSSPELEFMSRPKTVIFTNTFDSTPSDLAHLSQTDRKLVEQHHKQASIIYSTIFQVFGIPFGKMFTKNKMGNYNFDTDIINPLTNEKINGHYLPGETFQGVFGDFAELLDCLKAESISLFLSTDLTTLGVFGVESEAAQQEISRVAWLMVAKGLLKSVTYYDTETKQWDSVHHQAKYILGNYLFQNDVFGFDESDNSVTVSFDSSNSVKARQTLEQLLQMLFVYRSIGNVEQFKVLTQKYSDIPEKFHTLSTKFFPRRSFSSLFVQPSLFFVSATENTQPSIIFKSYPGTKEGLIQSFADRFK